MYLPGATLDLDKALFFDRDNEAITINNFRKALSDLNAERFEILYIHTALNFGTLNPEISSQQLLEELLNLILNLDVATVVFPTYTFSFCRNEIYNMQKTKTRLGALNNFSRSHPNAIRSIDPLLSNVVIGKDTDLVTNLDKSSIGKNSNFHKLDQKTNVGFVFFGPELGSCFTYMHYLEFVKSVPYRYMRKFTGTIISKDDKWEDEYELFVRYGNITPNNASYQYQSILEKNNVLKISNIGDSKISLVEKDIAKNIYFDCLESNSNYFINEEFDSKNIDFSFSGKNMLAL